MAIAASEMGRSGIHRVKTARQPAGTIQQPQLDIPLGWMSFPHLKAAELGGVTDARPEARACPGYRQRRPSATRWRCVTVISA